MNNEGWSEGAEPFHKISPEDDAIINGSEQSFSLLLNGKLVFHVWVILQLKVDPVHKCKLFFFQERVLCA